MVFVMIKIKLTFSLVFFINIYNSNEHFKTMDTYIVVESLPKIKFFD